MMTFVKPCYRTPSVALVSAVGGVDETSWLAPCRFTGKPIIPCAQYAGKAVMRCAMLSSVSYLPVSGYVQRPRVRGLSSFQTPLAIRLLKKMPSMSHPP